MFFETCPTSLEMNKTCQIRFKNGILNTEGRAYWVRKGKNKILKISIAILHHMFIIQPVEVSEKTKISKNLKGHEKPDNLSFRGNNPDKGGTSGMYPLILKTFLRSQKSPILRFWMFFPCRFTSMFFYLERFKENIKDT